MPVFKIKDPAAPPAPASLACGFTSLRRLLCFARSSLAFQAASLVEPAARFAGAYICFSINIPKIAFHVSGIREYVIALVATSASFIPSFAAARSSQLAHSSIRLRTSPLRFIPYTRLPSLFPKIKSPKFNHQLTISENWNSGFHASNHDTGRSMQIHCIK